MGFMERTVDVDASPFAADRTSKGYIVRESLTKRIDYLKDHYEVHEDWWDIDPEDYDKLSDMSVVEDIILLSKVKLGYMHAERKYALHKESVTWVIKRFKQRLKERDSIAVEMNKRITLALRTNKLKRVLKRQLQNQREYEKQVLRMAT
jgi:hypothetical protein